MVAEHNSVTKIPASIYVLSGVCVLTVLFIDSIAPGAEASAAPSAGAAEEDDDDDEDPVFRGLLRRLLLLPFPC